MKMTRILAGAVALALFGAGGANAATLPSAPTNSSLIVTVFDVTNNESLTVDLGLFYSTFVDTSVEPGTIKPAAYVPETRTFILNLSTFADNDAANIRFNVYAGDTSGSFEAGRHGALLTSNDLAPTMTPSQLNGINTNGTQLLAQMGANTSLVADYGDEFKWGESIGGQFAAPPVTAASFGNPLYFFLFTSNDSDLDFGSAGINLFGNAIGPSTWNLAADGTLTLSTPVPLPAAAWLLLSGIAGLGAFSRRRATQG